LLALRLIGVNAVHRDAAEGGRHIGYHIVCIFLLSSRGQWYDDCELVVLRIAMLSQHLILIDCVGQACSSAAMADG